MPDWVWEVLKIVPGFVGAATGGYALWRQVGRDKRAQRPRVQLEIGKEVEDGWRTATLWLRNQMDVEIRISQVEVVKPRGFEMAMVQRSRKSPGAPDCSRPDPTRMGSKVDVSWEVVRAHPDRAWSARTELFFRPKDRSSTMRHMSNVSLCIRLRFEAIDETRRVSTIKVISNPVEFRAIKESAIS